MDLTKMQFGPYAEGFIRVSTQANLQSGKLEFNGELEILCRHHNAEQQGEGAEQPRLATHPITDELIKSRDANKAAQKLVEIPIRMFFDKPANAITASYAAYDANGVPVCRGNGSAAKQVSVQEGGLSIVRDVPCPGNDQCDLVRSGAATCKRMVSMPVHILNQDNPFSVFEVRTSSYNSLRTLRGQLELIAKRFGGLRHVPLKLQLWQASNQASDFEPFDLFKLNLDAKSEIEAMRECKRVRQEEEDAGLGGSTDEVFAELSLQALDLAKSDDYAVVSDFYKPILSAETVSRRTGGVSVAAQLASAGGKAGHNTASAIDLISQAVKGAGRDKTIQEESISE